MNNILFVSGIDTDVGKSYATGFLAKQLAEKGFSVITQKMVQTGCTGIAADLLVHRAIQGIAPTAEDSDGLTCAYVYDYPCSPHLAAEMAARPIDTAEIDRRTEALAARYDYVLLEGAGGLAVPYAEGKTIADFIAARGYPLVLVTSGKLGSINHTLLSLEACQTRGIAVHTLVYNAYPAGDDTISRSTRTYLQRHLAQHFPHTRWLDLPRLTLPDQA